MPLSINWTQISPAPLRYHEAQSSGNLCLRLSLQRQQVLPSCSISLIRTCECSPPSHSASRGKMTQDHSAQRHSSLRTHLSLSTIEILLCEWNETDGHR